MATPQSTPGRGGVPSRQASVSAAAIWLAARCRRRWPRVYGASFTVAGRTTMTGNGSGSSQPACCLARFFPGFAGARAWSACAIAGPLSVAGRRASEHRSGVVVGVEQVVDRVGVRAALGERDEGDPVDFPGPDRPGKTPFGLAPPG